MKNKKTAFILVLIVLISSLLSIQVSALENNYSFIDFLNKLLEVKTEEFINKENTDTHGIKIDNKTAKITFVGDTMFHMPQVNAGYDKSKGEYNFDNNFKYIAPYIKESDLAVVNYETVAGGDHLGFSGFPKFNSPIKTMEAIKNAGFDVVNLANNHILDRKEAGLLNTVSLVKKNNMQPLGAEEKDKEKYVVRDVNGIKLGILSYSYGFNGNESAFSKEKLDSLVNRINYDKIKEDVEYLNNVEKVDYLISFIHWGNEYEKTPSKSQKEFGDKLFDLGIDAVIGSHPHVIQKSIYNKDENKYIIYSLGNFLSNQRREYMGRSDTEDGIMVSLLLEKDEEGNTRLVDVEETYTWVYKYYTNKNNYEIIPVKDALDKKIEIYNYNKVKPLLQESLKRTENRLKN